MVKNLGNEMMTWAADLFPVYRSLTGEGVRKTLKYISEKLPEMQILSVPSGTQAFDWKLPKEWKVTEAWFVDQDTGTKIDFSDNNLHLVVYSQAFSGILSREEFLKHVHSVPENPAAIPYVTSYYADYWGFCVSENQRASLGQGPFEVCIKSKHFDGEINYGELLIKGNSKKEILLSTYICHPSLANNELSGPVVAIAIAQWLISLTNREYSYRILFLPETIGAIYYLSKYKDYLKANVVAGWVLTCMGDNNSYSYLPTRNGSTLTDKVSQKALNDLGVHYKTYPYFMRGSDERQYCSPGIDLPIASIMRSKYHEYPEYHTSLDNLDFISGEGLLGGYTAVKRSIEMIETNKVFKLNNFCEPQLGKRNLYPNISKRTESSEVDVLLRVIGEIDGIRSLVEIAEICDVDYMEALKVVRKLLHHQLIHEVCDTGT